MSSSIMRRTTIGILLTAVSLVLVYGVYQTAYWFWAHRIARTALSYTNPDSVVATEKLEQMGEKAVLLVFDTVRAHQGGLALGEGILQNMASNGKLDPTIPCIGRVLRNELEDERIRKMASAVLVCMDSGPASDALADRALHDSSAAIRATCTHALGQQAWTIADTTGNWHVRPVVEEVLTKAARDRDHSVRYAACNVTGELADRATWHKQHLPWTRPVLERCLGDPDDRVRARARHWLLTQLRRCRSEAVNSIEPGGG